MKKILALSIIVLSTFGFPSLAFCQQNQQEQTGGQDAFAFENKATETKVQSADEKTQGLMDMGETSGEAGNQVAEIAEEQKQAQTGIGEQVEKLELRNRWIKTLFGPDYGAIRNLRQQMEQNRLRIQQLEQLQNQVTNAADETQLQEAIQALVEQNTALEEQIQAEEDTFSLLGWLIRLFI